MTNISRLQDISPGANVKDPPLNDYIDMLAELKNQISNRLLDIGKWLSYLYESEKYREQFETFEEFLGTPELSFSRAVAYKSMAVYKFTEKYKADITGIDGDKVYRIIKPIEKSGNLEEWLEKARVLSRSDLATEVRQFCGLAEHDYAKHSSEHVKEWLYEFCPKKGINPDELELEELLGQFLKWYKRNLT